MNVHVLAVMPLATFAPTWTQEVPVMTRTSVIACSMLCALVVFLPVLSDAVDKPAPVPDAQALLKSIPVLTEKNEKLASLLLDLRLQTGKTFGVKAHLAYRKPDDCALTMTDAAGTPIMVVAEDRMLLFDSVQQEVFALVTKRTHGVRIFSDAAQEAKFKIGVLTEDEERAGKSCLHVDVASFFNGLVKTTRATRRDKHVVLSATSPRGSLVRAVLDPSKPFPCSGFTIRAKGEKKPFVTVGIRANARVGPGDFVLPDLEVLRKHVDVREFPPAAGRKITMMADRLKMCMMLAEVRATPDTPEARAELERRFNQKIDWDAVKAFDRKAAEAYREAMKAARKAAESTDANVTKREVEGVAKAFMIALMDGDVRAMERLSGENLPPWARAKLEEGLKKARRFFTEDRARHTDVRETIVEGDFALVRLPAEKAGRDEYRSLVLQRKQGQWLVRRMGTWAARLAFRRCFEIEVRELRVDPRWLELVKRIGLADTAGVRKFVAAHPKLVCASDTSGRTALHHVVGVDRPGLVVVGRFTALKDVPQPRARFGEIATLLIDAGAEVDAKARTGYQTPLHLAVGSGHPDMVRLLIARGADVNARDEHLGGRAPLHLACDGGMLRDKAQVDIVRMLLENGADPVLESRPGHPISRRPLDLALPHRTINPPLVKLMRKATGAVAEKQKKQVVASVAKLLEAIRDDDAAALREMTLDYPQRQTEKWPVWASKLRRSYAGRLPQMTELSLIVVRSEWALVCLADPDGEAKPKTQETIILMTCPDGRWRAVNHRQQRNVSTDAEDIAHHLYDGCVISYGKFRKKLFNARSGVAVPGG